MRLIFLLPFMSFLGACSLGGGPAPKDHFYRLPEIVLDSRQTLYKTIVIKPVKSTGLYHERAILFINSEQPLELQRYHYSFWATTPAELVHNALYQGLQSSAIASQVKRNLSELRPDFIIDTRIINFERFIETSNVRIKVELEVSVRSGDSSKEGWTQRYKDSQLLQATDMHSSAEAFGVALRRISEALVADIISKK